MLTLPTLIVVFGMTAVLGYTAFVLHKVHTHATRTQPAVAPRGWDADSEWPPPRARRDDEPAPASPPESRPARKPRSKWATRLRVIIVLAATLAAAKATGFSGHWPALAIDGGALLVTAWLIRRR